MTVRRYDIFKLDQVETTPQGFLRFDVFAGRTGVQVYRRADGSVSREFRPPEEVFSEDTMSSLRGAPFTNNHPKEMVTPQNSRDLMKGFFGDTVQRVERDGVEYQKGRVTVSDADTIEDIKRGKLEVSLGYDLTLDDTPGEFNGMQYDAIQRNIKVNHLALVDRARGGRDVSLRLDGDDAAAYLEDQDDKTPPSSQEADNHSDKGDTMKVSIGDKEFDVDKDVGSAIKGLVAENAKLKKKTEKKDEDSVPAADLEKEKARADHAEAELAKARKDAKDDSKFMERMKERRDIERVAEKVLKKDEAEKIGEMDNAAIKKAVIQAECPNAKLDDATDAYVDARYDHIAETVDTSADATKRAGKTADDKRADDAKKSEDGNDDLDKKRQDSMKADSEAYLKGTPSMRTKN